MLTFTTGDMFEQPYDIRINTVNCVGVMGKGVALAFRKKYPKMFYEYKQKCRKNEIKPGELFIWNDLVINFPTKRHWRDNSQYEDIESGLQALREYLLQHNKFKSVAVPALGCGNGGLDWKIVSELIRKYLGDIPTEISVFEPKDSKALGEKYSQ